MRLHIRQIRRAAGMTQEQLAEKVEMNPATISQLERDKHGWTSHTLSLMATALAVPEHEVLGYSHPPDAELPEPTRELVHLVTELDTDAVSMLRGLADDMKKKGMVRPAPDDNKNSQI